MGWGGYLKGEVGADLASLGPVEEANDEVLGAHRLVHCLGRGWGLGFRI